MRLLWWMALYSCAASVSLAQGIRGVTRRTPTVIQGQMASQFFAAGGVPLNPVNPALATAPGVSPNSAQGNRGVAAMTPPMVRSGNGPTVPLNHPGSLPKRPSYSAYPAATPAVNAPRR
jgi:hypothetical protein